MAHRYRAVPIQICLRSMRLQFVQNMHVSRFCSNHAVYLKWHTTLHTRKGDDRAHFPRTRNQFASQSRLIRIIYPFVTLLLELSSANHIEVPSRINVVFCNVIVYAYRINTWELPTFLAKFAGLVTARNTNIIRRHTKCKLPMHAFYPLSNYWAWLTASNKS